MKSILKRLLTPFVNKPLNIGLAVFIIAILFLLSNLLVTQWRTRNKVEESNNILLEGNVQGNNLPEEIFGWEYFIHPEYKFSVYVPRLLVKREYEESTDYLFFVKFEENRFSEEKGVAIGVSDRNLNDEEEKTHEIVGQGQSSVEPKRQEMGEGVLRLYYEAMDGFESRTIYLINNGEYTYSISTTPEQIEKVLSGFVLLD